MMCETDRGYRKLRREDGASAVEFALVLPLFVLLLFGIIEFGLAFNDYITVTHAAREGARLAAVGDFDAGVVAARAAPLPVTITGPATGTDPSGNEYVEVTVSHPFNMQIPLWKSVALNISNTARMRREVN